MAMGTALRQRVGRLSGGGRLSRSVQIGILAGAFVLSVGAGWLISSNLFARTAAPATTAGAARGPAAVVVQTSPATAGPIRAVLTYASTVQATQQVGVAPRTLGVIQELRVDVGATVKKGDVLAVLDQATALAQVQQAQAGVDVAAARLAQMQAGPRPEDLASARAQLAQAQARLSGLQSGRPEDIAAAQAQLDAAQTRLDQLLHPLDGAIESARQALASAQAAYDAAVRAAGTSSNQLLSARANMEKAMADLQAAQARYDRVAWRPDVGSTPEAVALQQATITFQQAKAAYDSLASTVDTDNQAKIQAAAAQLASATDRLNLLLNPSPQDIAQAQQAVLAAQQALARAQQPGTDDDIRQQQQVVAQMQAQLQLRSSPYTDTDLQVASAQLAQAQAQLAIAQANLDQTVLTAPFDGIIAQRLLNIGALASTQTPVFTIISSSVEVHTTLEEARVGLVAPGAPAQLTVPAYPGVVFAAKVDTIAPIGDARAHTFDVKIVPTSQDSRLKPGMFAQVQITAQEKPDAILIPVEAVVRQGENSIVFVVQGGRANARPVQTGLSDDKNVEILSGVSAGDQVVTLGQNGLRDGQAVQVAGPARGAPGGAPGSGQTRPGAGGAAGSTAQATPGAAQATPAGARGTPAAGR